MAPSILLLTHSPDCNYLNPHRSHEEENSCCTDISVSKSVKHAALQPMMSFQEFCVQQPDVTGKTHMLWRHFLWCNLVCSSLFHPAIQSGFTFYFCFFYLGELSLTLLSLERGWVNPFLSRTHAAPVHHCSTQNTRVQLCSRTRQQGGRRQENELYTHTHMCKHTQDASPLFGVGSSRPCQYFDNSEVWELV